MQQSGATRKTGLVTQATEGATMSHNPEQLEPEANMTAGVDAAIDASKDEEFSVNAEESMGFEAAQGHTVVTGSAG